MKFMADLGIFLTGGLRQEGGEKGFAAQGQTGLFLLLLIRTIISINELS